MLRESIYIALILILCHIAGIYFVKYFMKYVFAPKKRKLPSLKAGKFKPLTCQGCMIFWLSILFLSIYNWILNGLFSCDYWLYQIIFIILSLINFKLYETFHSTHDNKARTL